MSAQFEVCLPHTVYAPGIARRSLAQWLQHALDGGELDTAKLLAGELVTNAVLHGQGKITLRTRLDDDCVRVEVIDEGPGFERSTRPRYPERPGGLGLKIVAAVATRWGIDEGATRVWFELGRPVSQLGPATEPIA